MKSTDEDVTKDLIETLEDGEDGYDISAELRTVIEQQRADVKMAHDTVRSLRDAH